MKRVHAALGAVLFAFGTAAAAQTWPTKPITFLNPFPAGGGTDTFARPIAARVSQTIGQQVIVENQGGAGGTVGAANVVKRAPDGYNWFFGAVHHTIAVIGRAGENCSRIACILTDTGDASGQGGFGGVMGSKNLKAIAVRGTGAVAVARPKALMQTTRHIHSLFARKPAKGNPYEPEEKEFKYNIWGGGYGRGGLSLLPGELQDLCNDPSSGYSQIPDGCFACPVSCRSRVKGPDITEGVAFCAQSYMYLESMIDQPEKWSIR